VLVLIAFACYSFLTVHTPIWAVVGLLSLQGFGQGLTTAPTMVAALSELPSHLIAQGSAVRSLLGQLAAALGVAVIGAVVASRGIDSANVEHAQKAFNSGFMVCGAGVLVAIYLGSRLPGRTFRRPPAEALLME
jgi:hypothetical protein